MILEAYRCCYAGVTDSADLRVADVLGAIGVQLRQPYPITAREDVTTNANAERRSARPRQRQSDVVDRPEYVVAFRHHDSIGIGANHFFPLETRLERAIEKGG